MQPIAFNTNDILYLKGSVNYSVIHYKSGVTEMVPFCLKSMQKRLGPGFERIHKSYLVNQKYVLSRNNGTSLNSDIRKVEMVREVIALPISRRRRIR